LFVFSSISAGYLQKFEFLISQCSVPTCRRWGGYCCISFVANFILFPALENFWKSVKIWQSYREFKVGNFFETQCRTADGKLFQEQYLKIWQQSSESIVHFAQWGLFHCRTLCIIIKRTEPTCVHATVWVVVAVVWRKTMKLVRSERSEVEQCQVDALSLLCSDDPRSVYSTTGCRHISKSLAWDITWTARYRPYWDVVRDLIMTGVRIHRLRCSHIQHATTVWIFSSRGWAFRINWSNAVCSSVSMCIWNVNQGGTNRNRCIPRLVILHAQIY